jgi:hypothetical protein
MIFAPAVAIETYSVGPFDVRLDLGFPSNLSVLQPLQMESLDGICFTWYVATGTTNTGVLLIGIGVSRANLKYNVEKFFSGFIQTDDIRSIDIRNRKIDGHNATIGSGRSEKHTSLIYSATWNLQNNTSVVLASWYPWDNGTRQLLNTINVTNHVL